MSEDFTDITDILETKLYEAAKKIQGIKVTYDLNLNTYDLSIIKKNIEEQSIGYNNGKGYMILGKDSYTEPDEDLDIYIEESISE